MHIRIKQIIVKGVLVGLTAALSIGLTVVGEAAASPLAASRARAAVASHPVAALSAAMGAPSGCPSGAVCFYRKGNGGDLCGIWYGNAPTLGACANIGQSGSIFNNGQNCAGCQDVKLYYNSGYSGAYYCLPKGGYLLHIDLDRFNRGNGLPGFNQTLGYRPGLPGGPGGVASARWTSC